MENKKSKIGRRRFLKLLVGASIYGALGSFGAADAQSRRYGKLVDTSKCIGCKRCMSACKRWNKLRIDREDMITDREIDLSANNLTVVNLSLDSKNRDRKIYLKWQCQHCREPACAGACPVQAAHKVPEGAVLIDPDKCIGCMYCYQSCPYKVPRFDFGRRIATKCTLCYDRTPLLNYMKPACVAACPVQAISFGPRDQIIRLAKIRTEELGGSSYILGLEEAGGTDVLTILTTKPQDLGLVVAPKKVVNQTLDKLRITAIGFLGAYALAGLTYAYGALTREKDENNHNGKN